MKMSKRAERALESSIKHWERMANGKGGDYEDIYGDDCALCLLYRESGCVSCPVEAKTGKPMCIGTPWRGAAIAGWDYGYDSKQFKSAAKKELAFLKSLRPRK